MITKTQIHNLEVGGSGGGSETFREARMRSRSAKLIPHGNSFSENKLLFKNLLGSGKPLHHLSGLRGGLFLHVLHAFINQLDQRFF